MIMCAERLCARARVSDEYVRGEFVCVCDRVSEEYVRGKFRASRVCRVCVCVREHCALHMY